MSAEETKEILKKAYLRIKELERELASKLQAYEPIAIVGGALRFAGADSPAELFELLLGGNDMVVEYPVNRWQVSDWKSEGKEEGKAYSFAASYLENIELFDNLFFNIPPEECQYTDPQQRLLLETTVEALQSAGITLANASGSRTSVFIGSVNSGYDELVAPTPTEYSPTGSIVASASGKISYKLNLKAPALTIDTACSSSLAAIHLGCKSIHSGESDVAIAGGVNLIMTPRGHIGFSQLGAMTTDGKAKVFDKNADGFSRGEGCGVVVLKKLKDAERDGDNILGIIRGSAMNHDGQSNGYTAPSQQSQEAVIQEALRLSGLNAAQIGYIEAHGTGTSLGDSIELQALHKVFGKNSDDVFIGSIKANLGHTEYAAGMASIFKTLKVLQHRRVSKQIHVDVLNPHFNWAASSLKVSSEGTKELNELEYAGISGFGISGTNVHIVMQRSVPTNPAALPAEDTFVLYLSARNQSALAKLLNNHITALAVLPDVELAAYVRSNNIHRDHFEYRTIVSGTNKKALAESIAERLSELKVQQLTPATLNNNKIVFVFPGQGSQWLGMASELYKHQTIFRNAIHEAENAIKLFVDIPVSAWVEKGSATYLKDERTIQPVLFAIQVALAKLWMAQGIRPDVLLGLSMGEVAAMHVAGALTMRDAAKIICKRSQLLVSGVSGYEMCIAEYNSEELNGLLQAHTGIEVSGYYSGTTHLFSGPFKAMQVFVDACESAGIFVKRVRTSVASHCSAVKGVLPELKKELQDIVPGKFCIPVFSSVYNRFVDPRDIGADYWLDNLQLPIRFNDSIVTLEDLGSTTFVEISAHPLTGNYLQQIFRNRSYIYQPSLFRDHNCNTVFYQSLGLLYASGVAPVFSERVPVHPLLPLYAWDKQLFPIPYHNYGRSTIGGQVHNDIQVMLPEWKAVKAAPVLSAMERQVFYCRFNDTVPYCKNDGMYDWQKQAQDLIHAINEDEKPVIIFDVSAIGSIDEVTIVLDALKTLEGGVNGKQADLVLLSSNSIPVTGNEPQLHAAGYAWLGMARTLQTEWEHINVHWIDTDVVLSEGQLLQAISADSMGSAVVCRNGNMYSQYLHQQVVTKGEPQKVDTVLIVGGTSAMGLLMAGWYANRGASTIILHGSRPVAIKEEWDIVLAEGVDGRMIAIIAAVKDLEDRGVKIFFTNGDICEEPTVSNLKKIINEYDIVVDDIVFAAGSSLSHMFSDNTTTQFIQEANTRITGWQNLVSDNGIAFKRFIFISSASGFFRATGQSPYLFANHWIDAASMAGDKHGRKYKAILFPIWKEVGRAAEEAFLPDTLLEHASNKDLEAYFDAIIDNDVLPPVVVAARPAKNGLAHLWKQVPFIPGRGLGEWVRKLDISYKDAIVDNSTETIQDELSALLHKVWVELLGKPKIYPNDHFFQAGGNSVLLVKLANRVKSQYRGIDIKVPELIKNLTFHAQYEMLHGLISQISAEKTLSISRAAIADKYPASEEQKQIWVQSQLDEDTSLYNLTGVYSYEGVLNADSFIKAIHHLAAEQEIFRTKYLLEDGNIVQLIDEADAIPITFIKAQDENDVAQLTDKVFKEESAYRFDLSAEHSFRITVINGQNARGIIILNLHHIASDGWALGYYTGRLSEVYKKYCLEEDVEQTVAELTYKDYAVYQHKYLQSQEGDGDKVFWQQALSGGTAAQYLSIDNERPQVFEFKGRKQQFFIDTELTKKVYAFVEKNGISLYAFLQTALSSYLSVLSGEKRVVTGTPMSSRVDERLETTVGNFVNLIPVSIEIDKTKTFKALSFEMQQVVADAMLHQLYPFNRIIQDLKLKRDPARHPVFDILFVLQNHKEADFQLEGLQIERRIIDPEHSKLDLFIEARELDNKIEFNLEFNDGLFHGSTILNFWNGLQGYLLNVLDSPDTPLDEQVAVKTVTYDAGNAFTSFAEQAQLHPEKIALRSEYENISYAQLLHVSERLAGDLLKIKAAGNAEHVVVAVACGRSAGQVAGMLGSWAAGMVYMPVSTTQTTSQLLTQVQLANCKILVCNKTTWNEYAVVEDLLQAIEYCVCYTGAQSWEIYKIENGKPALLNTSGLPQSEAGNSNKAYIVFTSGTTGKPKAIAGRHDSLLHFIEWQSGAYNIDEAVNTAWLIQPTFDASFRDVLLPLCNGGTLNIPAQETWELMHALIKWIDTHNITVIHIVPSLFRLLLGEIEAGYKGMKLFAHLKYIFLSGETVYKNDAERWQHIFGQRVQLVNFYGSSETTLIRTYYNIPPAVSLKENILPVGKPIADTELFVVTEGKLCSIGMAGNVFVQTDFPAAGYLTAGNTIVSPLVEDFLNENSGRKLYETGDAGYWNEDGNLVITGRIDDQVKVHGIRLHTCAVEAAIAACYNFNQLAVVYEEQQGVLKAYYNAGAIPDITAIRSYISNELSPLHIPDVWVPLTEFPLTAHGKADRLLLRTLDIASAAVDNSYEAPVTDTEKKLSALWTVLLKCEQVGRNADFFELGGNSLNGLVLLSRIHKDLQRKITLRALFTNPILSDMAVAVDNAVVAGLEVIPVQPASAYYPVSQAQRRMWILHNMEENSITYNIKRAYELAGDMKAELLFRAFRLLVEQQESLRTNFKIVEGVPVQYVRGVDDAIFKPELIDVSEKAGAETIVRSLANKEVQYHFDLEQESLLRVSLIKLEDLRWVLLVNMHHIISDGWSMELLMRELFGAYEKLLQNKQVNSEQLPVQYKDYTHWQQHKIDTNLYQKERTYWLKELSGEIPVLELPADNARAKIKTYEGEPLYFRLNNHVKARIEELCRKYDVSLFMFLLTTVKVLLHKYTGQKDLIIGSPVAGREHPDLNGMVGFFVNMLALRSGIASETTFEEYLQTIRQKTLDAFEHQSYPFDKLVEELPLQRNTSRSPLFDITVQVLNVEFWEADKPGSPLKVKPFIADWQRSQFDLSFFFKEEGNSIFSLIEFNNTIYSRKRIERLIAHFNVLLEQIIAQPAARIAALNYLSNTESQQLLYNNNDSRELDIPYQTVLDAIAAHGSDNNIAVQGLSKELPYAELMNVSARLSACLLSKGQQKMPVAVLTNDRCSLITAMLGIMRSGNIYMPLDAAHPPLHLKYMLQNAGVEVLVITAGNIPLADKLLWETEQLKGYICIDTDEIYTRIPERSELMRTDLWNYVGKQAQNEIEAGGWISSYIGQPFTVAEMEEYALNAFHKLQPYISANTRVLEIGCSSGLTLFKVAPQVASYTGIDLSEEILIKTRQRVAEAGLTNVELHTMYADEVDKLDASGFDLIIINSVIQSFGSYNYFREVVRKLLAKAADKAVLFLGDVQDVERKESLITSLKGFSIKNQGKGFHTKINWDDELFFHKDFIRGLAFEFPCMTAFDFSDKTGDIKNELSLFRFDAVIQLDKQNTNRPDIAKAKWQLSVSDVLNAANISAPPVAAGDDAYIIYTSGTTGEPKGARISYEALLNQVYAIASCFKGQTNSTDNVLMVCRPTFDVSILEMFTGLCHGATLVEVDLESPLGASHLTTVLAEKNVTWAYLPPSLLPDIADAIEKNNLTISLNKLLVGVEPIAAAVLKRFTEICQDLQIVNGYGPTETTIVTTTYNFNINDAYAIVPIGKPLPGYKVYILDETGLPVGVGIPGEIVISGKGVAKGYINNTELTHAKFKTSLNGERAYYTGDMGIWDEKGNMRFVGRRDRQIKFNGYRIELSEIESKLSGYPGATAAIAHIIYLGEEVKQLVVFVKSAEDIHETDLKQYAAASLPEFMLPQRIISVKDFPLTIHGKTDYKALEQLIYHAGKDEIAKELPANALEQSLLELYQSLLKQPGIGVTDNFFDIGGHSLIATRLVTRAAKDYSITIPLVNVFIHPTVRELANSLPQSETAINIELVNLNAEGLYPLSYAQNRLWIIDYLNPDDDAVRAAYNMVGLFEVNGQFDANTFTEAIRLVIDRHEILRTNFVLVDGVPHQRVHDSIEFNIEQRVAPSEVKDIVAYMKTETEKVAAIPFNLQRDVLLRCVQYSGQGRSFVIVVMHHIISDGWSMHVFSQELKNALRTINGEGEYIAPALQYKDYTAWNTNIIDHKAEAKHYWHSLLAGQQPPTVIPANYKRPQWRTFNGNTVNYEFDELVSKSVTDFCAAHQVTLYSFLVAVLNVLIHRYAGLHSVTIGSPVSGRTHASLEKQLGFYLNNIVIRNEVSGHVTLNELLAEVHQQVLQALQHQEYPFDKLVDELLRERDAAHSPFFDIYLALQNNEAPEVDFGSFQFKTISFQRKVSRYDLNFMFEEKEGLRLQLQYNTDLYAENTIAAICKHLHNIITGFTTNADNTIAALHLLDTGELEVLQNPAKAKPVFATSEDYTIPAFIEDDACNTIVYHFKQQANRFPANIALYTADAELSYKELDIATDNLAATLIESGVQKGDVVALFIGRNIHRVIGILATLKAGATYLPLDTNLPETRLAVLVADAGSKVLLTEKNIEDFATWFDGKIVRSAIDLSAKENTLPLIDGDTNAYILYTSGTTGKPKGVTVTHANVVSLMKHTGLFDFSEQDTWTLFHQYNFDFTVWEIWGALLFGGKLIIVPDELTKDLDAFAELVVAQKVTVLNQTPSVFYLVSEILQSKAHADLSALKYVIFGGDALRPVLLQPFAEKFANVKLVNMYGITETTVHVTCKLLGAEDFKRNHSNIGKPIPTLSTYILDEYMQPVPYGMPGQLAIAGAGLTKGYLNDAELTAAKFIEHTVINERLYLSGDLTRYLPNGDIEYLGRVDHQVKIRGHRIEPGEVEYALQNGELVQKAVVLKAGEAEMSRLLAFVTPTIEWKSNAGRLETVTANIAEDLSYTNLPNNLPLFHKNESETRFMYTEIVTEDGYMLQNLQLGDKPVVIDAGANIGMFSTLIATLWEDATIYAFEPMPEIYKCLSANAALHAPGRLIALNEGLSDQSGESELHYYAMNTVMSGGGSNDKELLGDYVRSRYAATGEYSEDVISAVVSEALDATTVVCKMRTLSGVIDDYGLQHIDLVKIDVEEWEQKLMDGIRDEHWAIINNLIAEVHDIDGRVAYLTNFLTGKGFNVEAQQTSILKGVALYNLKASRAKINGTIPDVGKRYHAFVAPHPNWYTEQEWLRDVKTQAAVVLPSYMVPDTVVLVNEFPLTVNGKLDRNKLLTLEFTDIETEDYERSSARAIMLLNIVEEVLQRSVSPKNNFFDIGGNSLNATQVINRVRSRMKVDLRVRDIFEHPVMKDLAACVEQMHSSNFPDITLIDKREHYLLSDAQQRIFTTAIIDGADSVAYNMTGGLLLDGIPDVNILEKAFKILTTRHEILRTRFADIAGEFVQIPCNDVKVTILQKEVPELSEVVCRQLILQDAATPFDLQKTPLLRCALFTANGKSLLVVSMHHIISDGWSMGVMTRELATIYNSLKRGVEAPLPGLAFQYKDYCGWLASLLSDASWVNIERSFWKTELDGFETLNLPYDYTNNNVQTYKGAGITHYIEEWQQVKDLAGKQNISLYAFLLATVNVLFAKVSGQNDIIIGTPVAGRPLLALEQQIGFYVNTLPVRMQIQDCKTFADVLSKSHKKSVDVLEHQLYPFNRIVEDVVGVRDMGHSPLFNVLFVWQNNNESEYVLDGIAGQKVDVDYESSIFDLSFIFTEVGGLLKMTLQYNSSLFAQDTAEALVTMFNSLVIAAASGFSTDIESIEL